MDTCQNCGRMIGNLETPYLWGESVVCVGCLNVLSCSPPVAAVPSEPAFFCPSCHSQNVASARFAYEAGKSNATFLGVGLGGGDGILVGGSQSQSVLSERAAPPPMASRAPLLIACISIPTAIIAGLQAIDLIRSTSNEQNEQGQKLLGIMCIAFIIGAISSMVATANANWNRKEYPRLLKLWQSKWICCKCGAMFRVNAAPEGSLDDLASAVSQSQYRQRGTR